MFDKPAISMQELEVESAELLPGRETLCVFRGWNHHNGYSLYGNYSHDGGCGGQGWGEGYQLDSYNGWNGWGGHDGGCGGQGWGGNGAWTTGYNGWGGEGGCGWGGDGAWATGYNNWGGDGGCGWGGDGALTASFNSWGGDGGCGGGCN